MGKYLTAESILAAEDFQYAEVDCPEWGGSVRVRSLSGGQRAVLKKAMDENDSTIDELLVVMCTVDEDGKRIFDKKMVEQLSKKNTNVISRIAIRILEISGMRDREQAVKDAEKNFGKTENDDSSFD